MVEPTYVQGNITKHNIMLYTISTCIWCRRLKNRLNARNFAYKYIDIDLIPYKEREKLKKKLRRYRSHLAFPMMFIDDEFVPNIEIDKKLEWLLQDL